jgi:hypothetical protein
VAAESHWRGKCRTIGSRIGPHAGQRWSAIRWEIHHKERHTPERVAEIGMAWHQGWVDIAGPAQPRWSGLGRPFTCVVFNIVYIVVCLQAEAVSFPVSPPTHRPWQGPDCQQLFQGPPPLGAKDADHLQPRKLRIDAKNEENWAEQAVLAARLEPCENHGGGWYIVVFSVAGAFRFG